MRRYPSYEVIFTYSEVELLARLQCLSLHALSFAQLRVMHFHDTALHSVRHGQIVPQVHTLRIECPWRRTRKGAILCLWLLKVIAV